MSEGRRSLLAELAGYRPAGERERSMADSLSAFVAGTPDCFERSHPAGHVTGSAWIVDEALRAAVLVHHRRLGRWLQPGGHADGDPDARAVALREAEEETGLRSLRPAAGGIYDVDVHEIPARPGEPAHLHYDLRFAFFADAGEAPRRNEESHEVAWVPLERLEAYGVDASVMRLAAKTASLRRP